MSMMDYNHEQARKNWGDRQQPTNYGTYTEGVMAERQRIVNLLMIQHEMAKDKHNYWQVAANLIQSDVASDT